MDLSTRIEEERYAGRGNVDWFRGERDERDERRCAALLRNEREGGDGILFKDSSG